MIQRPGAEDALVDRARGVVGDGRVRLEARRLADLEPAPYNPREIDAAALAGLSASIDRFGLVQLIVVNKTTARVVGGHQRLKVLLARGARGVLDRTRAELLGRRAFLMELDPAYCDVIVQRWEALTGKKAKRP